MGDVRDLRPGQDKALAAAQDKRLPRPSEYLMDCFRGLLICAEGPAYDRPGLVETPARAAKAWRDLTWGYDADVPAIFKVFEEHHADELVLLRGYPFASLCEHHLLPFTGTAHVGYLPDKEKIVGISKLARLVDAYAARLQVQERLTIQIADAIEEHLKPIGVIVVLEAAHSCMELRGVRRSGQSMVTSAVRGALKKKPEARAEALALIRGGNR